MWPTEKIMRKKPVVDVYRLLLIPTYMELVGKVVLGSCNVLSGAQPSFY